MTVFNLQQLIRIEAMCKTSIKALESESGVALEEHKKPLEDELKEQNKLLKIIQKEIKNY